MQQKKSDLAAIMVRSGGLSTGMIRRISSLSSYFAMPDKSQIPSGLAFGIAKTNRNGDGNGAHNGR